MERRSAGNDWKTQTNIWGNRNGYNWLSSCGGFDIQQKIIYDEIRTRADVQITVAEIIEEVNIVWTDATLSVNRKTA